LREPDEAFDPPSILAALARADVDFVVIGGVAGGERPEEVRNQLF